ncbi:NADH-quinone oxidoreductase subunit I [Candidatus Bathyarchaeota archaeon]|nr:MAG: NADH-quinone oxidoreductase subunit I [Candidatus Bathyarchaeota archaeon]RJS81209.1 MAG: NADH-quinone oxidoreductase subunit I [Candidatus Bathyarchaeota archaeon]
MRICKVTYRPSCCWQLESASTSLNRISYADNCCCGIQSVNGAGDDVELVKKFRLTPMLKEVLSHIFREPATRKYPEVRPEIPEGFRGRQVFDVSLCISCGLCARDCPAKAIEMVDVEGKKRPLFHLDRCIFCYQCAESCPRNAIKSSKIFELASTDKSELVVEPKSGRGN